MPLSGCGSICAAGLATAVTNPEPNAPCWSNSVAVPTEIPSDAQWRPLYADPVVNG